MIGRISADAAESESVSPEVLLGLSDTCDRRRLHIRHHRCHPWGFEEVVVGQETQVRRERKDRFYLMAENQ